MNTVLKAIHNGECSSQLSSGTTGITISRVNYAVDDQVKVLATAKNYVTGEKIKEFVKGATYQVIRVDHNKLLLSDIISWVYANNVEKVSEETDTTVAPDNTFLVEIICDKLSIRHNADFNSVVVGVVKRGEIYTITKEENGLGKLKSGVGYISMNPDYIRKK